MCGKGWAFSRGGRALSRNWLVSLSIGAANSSICRTLGATGEIFGRYTGFNYAGGWLVRAIR